MASISLTDIERRRLLWLWFGIFAGLLALVSALWHVQIGEGGQYADSAARQSLRRVRVPAMRGRIYDRNGVCLADNRPCYGVAVYLEELRRVQGARGGSMQALNRLIQRLEKLLGNPPSVTTRQIEEHLRYRRALPLVAWRDIGRREMARLAELGADMAAVDLVADAERVYPQGMAAGHLLGYVTRRAPGNDEEYHYYLPDLEGRAGLERYFDAWLSGVAGGQLVRVDAAGFRYEEISARPPVPGGDLQLALSLEAQRAAEQALGDVAGAAVVLDPSNGDVLALASAPAIDPNWLAPPLLRERWKALEEDPRRPLFNRAINGAYAPGSTFKPIVALAALQQGVIDAGTGLDCAGVFLLGDHTFGCYHKIAHGRVDVRRALEVSCNVFFYQAGLRAGPDAIAVMARAFGLGRRSGIEVDGEAPGLVPTREWKWRTYHEGWRDGDTCNLAIGQGALLVTPLQMAMVAAALANGGFVYRPRLVRARRAAGAPAFTEEPPVLLGKIDCAPAFFNVVREGLVRAVEGAEGTGRRAQLPGINVAGKTGTAEYGPRHARQKRGWMIAYAPAEAPRYAVAVVLDDIETSGGAEVGPCMRRLLGKLFQLPEEWL